MEPSCDCDTFEESRALFDQVCSFMDGTEAAGLTHGELEARLAIDARELMRQLFQDHLDLRAIREERLDEITNATGITYRSVEAGHLRRLQTIFGEVCVTRLAYRHRGEDNLYLSDATLNLPTEAHSHGLREISAIESARGSFEEARQAISRTTGANLGKRQVEDLAARSAVDFDAFY